MSASRDTPNTSCVSPERRQECLHFGVSKCTSTKEFDTPKMSSKAIIQGVMTSRSKEPCSSAAALLETSRICAGSAGCWSSCSCGLLASGALIKQTEVLPASGQHDLAIKQLIW